jgi:hypothetical protein
MKRKTSKYIVCIIIFLAILTMFILFAKSEGYLNDLSVGKWKISSTDESLKLASSESGKTVAINSDMSISGKLKIGSFTIEDNNGKLYIKKDSGVGDVILKDTNLILNNRNDKDPTKPDPTYYNSPLRICNNQNEQGQKINEYCSALGLNNKGDFTIYRENNKGFFIRNPDVDSCISYNKVC